MYEEAAVGAAAPHFSPVPQSWVLEKWGLLDLTGGKDLLYLSSLS